MPKGHSVNLRLDPEESDKLGAAAKDAGLTRHQLAKLIVTNYLAGWVGPYVLRKPLEQPLRVGNEPTPSS